MLLKEIYNFLKNFSNIISNEHKQELVNIQLYLEHTNNMKINKNKFGDHYEDCVWSKETTRCGPDTCHCVNYKRKNMETQEEARKIINFYSLSKCKNCLFYKD